MRNYQAMTTLIVQKLQSSGTIDYSVSEIDNQIEESLKEMPTYDAFQNIVPVIFKIESRFGQASETSADNLVDTPKGQFVAADATDEKVVHNLKDSTRAVVLSFSSTAQIGISADIFVDDEQYRIYNKRCWNEKQIFIGGVGDYIDIESVEYPIGQKRNWFIREPGVLEIDVATVRDSNAGSTITQDPNVDVMVRFNKPQILSQLTDLSGNVAASASAGETTLSGSSLQSAGTIEIGELFHVENHRTVYTVVAETTIASNTAGITFFPGFEAAVAGTAAILTFVGSSLLPNQEDIFAELTAARLSINKSPKFFNAVTIGGANAGGNFQSWGERKLSNVIQKMRKQSKPKVNKFYPSDDVRRTTGRRGRFTVL